MSSTSRSESAEGRSTSDKSAVVNSLSRSGKVETDLIETILGEMKNEFNRGVDIEDNLKNKNDESSKDSTDDECVAVKKESSVNDSKSDIKSEAKMDKQDSLEMQAEGDTVQKEVVESTDVPGDNLETNKAILVENDDSKYVSVLTLKPENGNRKMKDKNVDNENNSNDTLSCDIQTGSGNVLPAPSGPTSLGKRSLRSKAALAKLQLEEPAGVKRSARRRSKDSPRESVLQSAIARKEKSFSSLSHSKDKNFTSRSLKILRHSPIDRNQTSRTPKSAKAQQVPAPKSPRLAQQIAGQASKEEETTGTNDESSVLNHSDQPVVSKIRPSVQTNNTQAYTKTGKRRYRPYKGLRYSFTGNNVRRTKPVRKHMKDISNSGNASEAKKTPKPEGNGEEMEVPPVTSHPEQLEGADPIAESHAAEFPVVDVCGSRSGSPVIAEACHTTSQKRKLQPDEDEIKEDRSKRSRDSNVPSPSPADSSQGPAKPESTAISNGVGTAALCCCQTKSQLFVSSRGQNGTTAAELYCQAMDTLDDRLVGCCNAVSSHDTRLSRPSYRVPFLILCDVHMQRLVRHNCCPGCGVFCTQGKFVQCASGHWYHRDCQLTVDSAAVCPHCGLNSPSTDIILTMRTAKNPVFLPQQKPPKKVPSAKMSFGSGRGSGTLTLREASPPILSPALLMSNVSSSTLDKDKLAHLLNVACSMHKPTLPTPRYSLKSLHQAAKSGNAEKLIQILGSGLNPNHVFRECSMGTALHAACAGGHLSVVHILLQAGANVDVLDRDQNSPLMLAAMANHNAVVKYLVKAGANVMLKGCDGMTALHLAAKAGNVESCHYLLTVTNIARVFINSVDDGGWTPLVWAAEHCHVDVARYLLQNRADPLIRDTEQNIALHWSAFSGSVDISEMLLNYGCEVNSSNVHGDTPLHIGARQNMYSCVLLLLARGARVDIANRAGDNPLECCLAENSDCYVAINLNLQLKAIVANMRQRTQRILTNDISRGQEQNPIQCVNMEDDEGEPTDFVYVSENCFTSNINVDRTITSLQSCKCTDVCSTMNCHCGNISLRCWYDDQGRLLPDFNYADPPMLFECNQACTCNRILCQNRVVQHGLTARFQLFRTKDKGWGVRTLRAISKGTYVCEYIGEIISDCEADHREDDSYLFDLDNRDGETYCIDARHYGNVARFINHMCVPNLLPVRVFIEHQDLHFPRIAFFANRDIEADEELGWVKTSRGSYI